MYFHMSYLPVGKRHGMRHRSPAHTFGTSFPAKYSSHMRAKTRHASSRNGIRIFPLAYRNPFSTNGIIGKRLAAKTAAAGSLSLRLPNAHKTAYKPISVSPIPYGE